MWSIKRAGIGAVLALAACGPSKPPPPLPGDPVVACRAGIREACAILAIQQRTMQQLSRPVPVQPVRVHGAANAVTRCQTYYGNTECRTSYR